MSDLRIVLPKVVVIKRGKYVFSQIFDLVSANDFLKCVKKCKGNYKTKHFSCWNQFLCIAFGQITHRESFSGMVICIRANCAKLYHLGIGRSIGKSTLSKANENRDWRIYQDFALPLIEKAKRLYEGDNQLDIHIKNNIFIIDSTLIDRCLNLYPWAKFRKAKGEVKAHVKMDAKTSIPDFILITGGKVHDTYFLDLIPILPESFYILDRGYLDYGRLYRIHRSEAYFVIRAKKNTNLKRLYSSAVDKTKGVKCDQTVRFKNFYAVQDYPDKLRRIKCHDTETGKNDQ